MSDENEEREVHDFLNESKFDGFFVMVHVPRVDRGENPQRFVPPTPADTPEDLFKPACVMGMASAPCSRFVRRDNPNEGLVYIDGCCLNNGQDNPRAGFSVVYGPPFSSPLHKSTISGTIQSRLENKGPDGKTYPQTSNRAELRAAIAALQFRFWIGNGFTRFVIATDSEYVVKGATQWVKKWKENNWITAQGTPAKNQDLWECLFKQIDKYSDAGMRILFWLIPREQNSLADRLAKEAALLQPVKNFTPIIGMLC